MLDETKVGTDPGSTCWYRPSGGRVCCAKAYLLPMADRKFVSFRFTVGAYNGTLSRQVPAGLRRHRSPTAPVHRGVTHVPSALSARRGAVRTFPGPRLMQSAPTVCDYIALGNPIIARRWIRGRDCCCGQRRALQPGARAR